MTQLDEILATRQPSFVTTMRCDIRSVATLALFARKNNENFRSKGELLRLSIEQFTALIIREYPDLEVPSIEDALRILRILQIETKPNRVLLEQIKKIEVDQMNTLAPESAYQPRSTDNSEMVSAAEEFIAAEKRRRSELTQIKRDLGRTDNIDVVE